MIDGKAQERFWSKVDRQGPDDCWEWQSVKQKTGYGFFWYAPRMTRAHRIAYAISASCDVPEASVVVRHKCDNRICVNPNHLEIGSSADNIQDMLDRRRHRQHSQTHCVNGHEFIGHTRQGHRTCRICDRANRLRWRLKNGQGASA